MSDALSVPNDFDGIARLFPLPNVVLFPDVMLPLHIFEPRYRQMTAEALDDNRLIALVLLKPGWEADYEDRPALYPVGCLGNIVAHKRLEDGRFHIFLSGLSRVQIQGELESKKLYRSARVQLLQDEPLTDPPFENAFRDKLSRLLPPWFPTLEMAEDRLAKFLNFDILLGTLCDVLSFALPLPLELKQQLLEELEVERRARQLLLYLETHQAPEAAPGQPDKFPPDFSAN